MWFFKINELSLGFVAFSNTDHKNWILFQFSNIDENFLRKAIIQMSFKRFVGKVKSKREKNISSEILKHLANCFKT